MWSPQLSSRQKWHQDILKLRFLGWYFFSAFPLPGTWDHSNAELHKPLNSSLPLSGRGAFSIKWGRGVQKPWIMTNQTEVITRASICRTESTNLISNNIQPFSLVCHARCDFCWEIVKYGWTPAIYRLLLQTKCHLLQDCQFSLHNQDFVCSAKDAVNKKSVLLWLMGSLFHITLVNSGYDCDARLDCSWLGVFSRTE